MEAGIAATDLLHGLQDTMIERDEQELDAGCNQVRATLEDNHKRGRYDQNLL